MLFPAVSEAARRRRRGLFPVRGASGRQLRLAVQTRALRSLALVPEHLAVGATRDGIGGQQSGVVVGVGDVVFRGDGFFLSQLGLNRRSFGCVWVQLRAVGGCRRTDRGGDRASSLRILRVRFVTMGSWQPL